MFDQREEVSLYREGGGEDHGVEVDPQLANVAAAPVRMNDTMVTKLKLADLQKV